MDTPSLGRIVHVVGDDGRHLAAIVTNPEPDDCGRIEVRVFDSVHPERKYYRVDRGYGNETHSWHWPERVL